MTKKPNLFEISTEELKSSKVSFLSYEYGRIGHYESKFPHAKMNGSDDESIFKSNNKNKKQATKKNIFFFNQRN